MGNETNTQRGGLHAYRIRVAAGKSTKRTVRGTTIRVQDSPYPVTIIAHNKKLNDGRGTSYSLEMKKFEKWFTDLEYDEIEIQNDGAQDIFVTLQLGYGDFFAEILSRTLAAPTIVVGEVDLTCTLGPGDIPTTVNGGIAELVPENGQRKRIKIQAFCYLCDVTGDPGIAIAFGVSDIDFIVEIGPPVYALTHSGSPSSPNYINAATDIDNATPLFLGEIELETTDEIWAHSFIPTGSIAALTDITYQVRFRYVEEVYSAS